MIRHFNLNLFVNNKNNNDKKKPTSKYSNQSPEYSRRKIKKNMILDIFVSSNLHLRMFANEWVYIILSHYILGPYKKKIHAHDLWKNSKIFFLPLISLRYTVYACCVTRCSTYVSSQRRDEIMLRQAVVVNPKLGLIVILSTPT